MNNINLNYVLDVFKALTTELPDQMLYRENGDSIELRAVDDTKIGVPAGNDWTLISCHMAEAV